MKQTHPRVLFLHSPAPGAEGTPPLGAGCVAAALAASGAASLDDIRLLEVPADDTENALLSAMRTFEPDVVGFSCYVWNSASLVRLAGRLREASPTTLLVAGGPDAEGISLDPLRSAPFDALFLGEAELSFPSWLSRRLAEGRHE